ncbi:hypothetical protein GCM10012285_54130 [Streptomyces kronopolitis]|uniref:Uncharacterized protein n=1 Tax=Streptomyces kronopolitis TaxID=1612435 RepID=A0ABQ2JUW6_9ACTN|nr:hypothetical protein GCM10012285_54130 [Streptomyces kronopolitis]
MNGKGAAEAACAVTTTAGTRATGRAFPEDADAIALVVEHAGIDDPPPRIRGGSGSAEEGRRGKGRECACIRRAGGGRKGAAPADFRRESGPADHNGRTERRAAPGKSELPGQGAPSASALGGIRASALPARRPEFLAAPREHRANGRTERTGPPARGNGPAPPAAPARVTLHNRSTHCAPGLPAPPPDGPAGRHISA